MEQMCKGSKFQVAGTEPENALEEKLLVMPNGLVSRLVLEEHKHWVEGTGQLIQRDMDYRG